MIERIEEIETMIEKTEEIDSTDQKESLLKRDKIEEPESPSLLSRSTKLRLLMTTSTSSSRYITSHSGSFPHQSQWPFHEIQMHHS